MDRYLIESPHELKDCARVLRQTTAMGYLHYFDWGCKAGVHCGWAIIEAENEAQARLAVPPLVRSKARGDKAIYTTLASTIMGAPPGRCARLHTTPSR
ncbi:MAG: hypothetical protein C4309_05225 [Chloroflexota bacterium]